MDCHFLLQGIFLTQELNPGLRIADRGFTVWALLATKQQHCSYKQQLTDLGCWYVVHCFFYISEFEWTPGVGDGQGGLACCDSWGCKESDTTERLNWTEMNWYDMKLIILQIAFFTKQSVLACFLYWCLENYFIHFSCCMIFHVMNKPFIYLGLFSLCCINWLLGYFHFSSLMKNMLIDASLCTCVGVFLEQIQRNGITGA